MSAGSGLIVDLSQRYSDGSYLAHNPGWHAEHGAMKARWIDAILKRNGLEPMTIAEIGCGSGELLVELKARRPRAQITGFEISSQAYAICSAKQAEGLEFRLENLISASAGPFDLVMAIDVFEHVPDYLGFLRELKGKGGHTLFHIPLDLSVQALLRATSYPILRNQTGHLHYFFKYTALATLRDCGYEILDWTYTRSSQELPGKGLKTKIANVPRRLVQLFSEDLSARLLGGYSLMVLAR
ncbi:class I SAM-dependent methyltransferase [Sphingomonas sp. URHD0057]|uniref:class I SAM-dependent methyltransferase n=1 Tax=Sphingomonas sp. URHD0057 TaxID=1380389 RepID=UPI0006882FA0|nr:class I SAM-dependent methyltransferase [Sphingomonas sp. URHD0057]